MSVQAKSTYEIAVEAVRTAHKGTKIVESEVSTGTSFFEGKKRLCKVLKSKKAGSVEINVVLDKATEEKFNLNRITAASAKAKHLGTMKYMATINDLKELPILLKAMVESFKAEAAAEKAAHDKAMAQ